MSDWNSVYDFKLPFWWARDLNWTWIIAQKWMTIHEYMKKAEEKRIRGEKDKENTF